MDIQGWLQDTADRAAPVPSDDIGALAFGRPIQGIEATTTIPRRRTRKRAASDSSIIAPQRPTYPRGKVDERSANPARDQPVQVIVSRSNSASRHLRTVSQEHVIDDRAKRSEAKPYERRTRHKTKPDRYDPQKSKVKAQKQRDDTGEQKSKRKRSRVNRGGDGKRTEKLVQGFQLKNGPSKSRLTLNPDTAAGMFKHGRTSAQMAGLRDGLPDLVFNELKFLRYPNEHQDEHQFDAEQRKPGHQGKKREAEREEISAYFNQRKSHGDILHSPPSKKRARYHRPDPKHGGLGISREGVSSPTLPDAELTARPYLGFGSKGTVNQSSHPQPSQTTYLTWSESVNDSHTRANNLQDRNSPQEPLQSSTSKPSKNRPLKHTPHLRTINGTAKQSMHENPSTNRRGRRSASRRVGRPASVEVYKQRTIARDDPALESQELHDATSPSLPTRPLVQSTGVQQRDRKQERQILPSDAESFHTSDILKIRGKLGALADKPPSDIHTVDTAQSNKENVQPASSSSMAKILQTAHEAISKTREEPARQVSRQVDYVSANVQETAPRLTSRLHAPQSHQLPQPFPMELTDTTRQVMRPSSSIPGYRFDERLLRDSNFESPYAAFEPEDDAMLDNCATFQPGNDFPLNTRSVRKYANTYVPTTAHSGAQSTLRPHNRPSLWALAIPWSRNGTSNVATETPSHAATVDLETQAEEHRFDGGRFDDGLEGFWRPNRLY